MLQQTQKGKAATLTVNLTHSVTAFKENTFSVIVSYPCDLSLGVN